MRTELRQELEDIVPALLAASGIQDLRVQGKDGTGLKTEIPWTRIYSASRSPRPTNGWYVVFLFSAAGDRLYLSLNQGTTRWDGAEFRAQPEKELTARTDWARSLLTSDSPFPDRWTTEMNLDNRISQLGSGYELGNVVAVEYALDAIPADDLIEEDLRRAAVWLSEIYEAADEGLYVPGDSPEIADTERSFESVARPRTPSKRSTPRLSAIERRVIEEHAVQTVITHLESTDQGYEVKDVGLRESYDLHSTKAGSFVKVEVKGTTSNGSEIVLTRNEVELHKTGHPANALAIVRNITLHRQKGCPPTASGGELILEMPWKVDDDRLAPIAYRYRTGQ
ncbi:MrcB family domain-containing protein [Mycobacterium sp. BMJ-28]